MKKQVIRIDGEPFVFEIGEKITIGRIGYGANIEINDQKVSRQHGIIEAVEEKVFILDLESSNGIFINGERVPSGKPIQISEKDIIKIGSSELRLQSKKASSEKGTISKSFSGHGEISKFKETIKQKKELQIGRLPNNDIVFNDPTVSRAHARISYENNIFWIEDLGSVNHTYVNGNKIKTKTKLRDSDVVTISFYAIGLREGAKDLREESNAINAVAIQKIYPNHKIGLQSLSLEIPHSSFVALMGPSGCGKSTLLKCLNGDNPATAGEVFIHGLSLRENFNLIKKKIGYVPQDDIIHKELTVYKTLFYAAKLRLPDDTSNEEIDNRINKVIADLNLDQDKEKGIKSIKVGNLSGGQRKRISIAVELLTEPTILFLDEPTSPLDPETIESFLTSIKKLTSNRTTIIMVTHKPEDLNYVDQVIFLGVQGHLVYKGLANGLVSSFEVDTIVEVYSEMSHIDKVKNKYIKPNALGYQNRADAEIKREKPDSLWLQLFWLISRYLNIKLNDRENLFLLLAQPLIIGGLVCLVFNQFRVGVLFLMTISAIWFGVSNSAKEIVGELSVYRRERMFNLNINIYILSKWAVLSLIAFVQSLLFVTIVYLNFKYNTYTGFDEVYLRSFWGSTALMFFLSFSGSLIGLWLSSSLNTTEKVMTVVPIILMPQIMLAGVMTKINTTLVEVLSFFTLGRWGTEGFSRLQDEASPDSKGVIFGQVQEFSASAMDVLNLYDKNLTNEGTLIGGVFNGFDQNIIAILILNSLFYMLIYYALKKKDSI
ncbi:FHA domain-containing protein [Costertonia aggregata]|uniref:FHA domain-containing protein n=1 Tax=Costertonia aggregata TaxID=343403 RepID=A0A7H9ANU7_9FLAO|nr:FHA domain-containing protein [Costertonia aggregata]QLG45074.1 FHA domain-containing protein [Costertonia aggregata]